MIPTQNLQKPPKTPKKQLQTLEIMLETQTLSPIPSN